MLKAIGQQVILEIIEEEIVTDSGIIITGADPTKQFHGVWADIITVGNDVKNRKPGERVMFNKYDGVPFRYKDKTYQCVKEELVFAVDK
jgi:co-chaperonin GroES (HSP10)